MIVIIKMRYLGDMSNQTKKEFEKYKKELSKKIKKYIIRRNNPKSIFDKIKRKI